MTPWSWKPVSSLLLKVLCHCLDEVGFRVLAFKLSFFSSCWSPFSIITGDKNEWFNFVILVINSANLNQCFLTSFEYQLLGLFCLHPLQALYLVFKFIFFWFKLTMNLSFFSLLNFAFTLSELQCFIGPSYDCWIPLPSWRSLLSLEQRNIWSHLSLVIIS